MSEPALTSHADYDFWGRASSRRFSNGRTLTYEYPDGFPLRTIKLDGAQVAALSDYSPYTIPRVRSTSAATTTLSYAPDGFLADAVSSSLSGVELQKLHFDHDPIGNLSQMSDQRVATLVNGVETSESQSFQYDGVNRLKQATGAAYGSIDYDFDSAGNLTRKGDVAFTRSGSSWTATRGGAVVASWGLDAAGDVLSKTEGADQWGYDYDAERRLSSVRQNSQLVAEFAYDSSGRRVRKTRHAPDGTTTTTWYLDGYELRTGSSSAATSETIHLTAPGVGALGSITTGTVSGQPTAAEVAGASGPLKGTTAVGPAEGTWWYLSNYVGSPSVVTDGAGAVAARYVYQPFGELQAGKQRRLRRHDLQAGRTHPRRRDRPRLLRRAILRPLLRPLHEQRRQHSR